MDANAPFVLAAYAAAAIVIVLLMLWVVLDHRMQKHALAELEARGIRRGRDA